MLQLIVQISVGHHPVHLDANRVTQRQNGHPAHQDLGSGPQHGMQTQDEKFAEVCEVCEQ